MLVRQDKPYLQAREKYPKPTNFALAVESILQAVELGIIAQKNRRREPTPISYNTYWR